MDNSDEQFNTKRTLKTSYLLKRLFKYLRPHLGTFIFAIALYIIEAGLAASEPLLIGRVIDGLSQKVTPELTREMIFSQVSLYGWLYCGVIMLNYCIIAYLAGYIIQVMSQSIIFDLRQDVFDHIQHLSIDQLHKIPVGKWVTRATNDVNAIMTFFSDVLIQIIYNLMYLLALLIFVFILNWQLALINLAFLPIILVVAIVFSHFSRKRYREVRSTISNMNAFLSENLTGMETIQVFNQEERKKSEFDKINLSMKKAHWGAIKIFAVFRPMIYFLYIMAVLSILAAGLPMVKNDIITIGALYSFYEYTGFFFNPIQNIANQFNAIQSALAGAERVIKVLDTPSEIQDEIDAKDVGRLKGKIEFKNVYFAYKDDDWILKDVSFVINPGDTVAFVGETGAGKSTIINLMCRNYDCQKGEILIDDIPIKKITISSLRRNIGEMLQDVFLFSGTVKSNISLGDESISDEKVREAATFVGADRFIDNLPNRYEEVVNENGNNFSQGQRQLISFARVVSYQPSVVVLDEATANIDTETEVIIQESLEKIKSIGTMVMVAHRLSTIRHATMIYVVDKGVIAERGNHQALLKKRGIYYNLYKLQTMESNMVDDSNTVKIA